MSEVVRLFWKFVGFVIKKYNLANLRRSVAIAANAK